MISAQLLLHSVNPDGQHICTWLLKYPRFIHSEIMTHRALSRNAASSRAIPVRKTLAAVIREPAVPEYWGRNQRGMQAASQLSGLGRWIARRLWLAARWPAVAMAWLMNLCGLHKQIANRILEPWLHMTVLVTGTEWANFFYLRAHPDAQPEFQALAYRMLDLYVRSKPVARAWGEWHIPYGDRTGTLTEADRIKVATARAARTSYATFDGGSNHEPDKDIKLHDRLLASGHLSPFEHCAAAEPSRGSDQGNFRGWTQYRKSFPSECVKDVNFYSILAKKPDWVARGEWDHS